MSIAKLIGSAIAAALAMGAAASANTITIGGTATITCTPSCQAIVGGSVNDVMGPGFGTPSGTPGSLSSTTGDLYQFSPSNPVETAGALNILAGTNFATGAQTDAGGVNNLSFTTLAQWVAFKLGAGSFFIFNSAGTPLQISYAKNGLRGGGLSNYTEFGQIPLPAAVWLMGAGLAGLAFAQRRRKP